MIEAAGGLIWQRNAKGTVKVLVIHRPRDDDWSFPKGKLLAGETARRAALREVVEETGLRCSIWCELPATRYRDRKGRSKRVRYWAMEPVDGAFAPNHEVDEVRWVRPDDARDLLSRTQDVAVLAGLCRALGVAFSSGTG